MNCHPEEPSISALKEEMLNGFQLTTKTARRISPPFFPWQVIFCENIPFFKEQNKDFNLQRFFRCQTICETLTPLLIRNLYIKLTEKIPFFASTFSPSSSSSNEVMELIRGVKKMIAKNRSKGVPIIMFTDQRKLKCKEKRGWFGCSDFG